MTREVSRERLAAAEVERQEAFIAQIVAAERARIVAWIREHAGTSGGLWCADQIERGAK